MNFVTYFRVSTKTQGVSGLGLEAQNSAVQKYVGTINGANIVASYTDIESGKNDNRVELQKAIDYCKKNDCTLLIAKLDRLSRNLTFISSLMDNKIKFVCADMPTANEFTIHIFASLAQQERKMISERTKVGLQEAKKRGTKLGKKENLTKEGRSAGVQAIKEKAIQNANNKRALAFIGAFPKETKTSDICKKLNSAGFKTSKGKSFTITQVTRLRKKIA